MDRLSVLNKLLRITLLPVTLAVAGCAVSTTRSGHAYQETVWMAPPPPRTEIVTIAPQPEYFWIDGYWGWNSNSYRWVPGYWEAPRNGYRWEPHHWEQQGRQWQGRPGHWERADDRQDNRRQPSDRWRRR